MTDAIVWPAYLDAEKSRSDGRRVPVEDAVPSPSAREIAQAVQQIGYDPKIEPDQRYPRSWWESRGRVRVRGVEESKRDLLRGIAVYLEVLREEGGDGGEAAS